MVANSDEYEKDLLSRFREALAECKRQPQRFENVEVLLKGAIEVLEKEVTQ